MLNNSKKVFIHNNVAHSDDSRTKNIPSFLFVMDGRYTHKWCNDFWKTNPIRVRLIYSIVIKNFIQLWPDCIKTATTKSLYYNNLVEGIAPRKTMIAKKTVISNNDKSNYLNCVNSFLSLPFREKISPVHYFY